MPHRRKAEAAEGTMLLQQVIREARESEALHRSESMAAARRVQVEAAQTLRQVFPPLVEPLDRDEIRRRLTERSAPIPALTVERGSAVSEPQPGLPRGVYRAPFLSSAGRGLVTAVDSHGCRRQEMELTEELTETRAVRLLESYLDEVDPTPNGRAGLMLLPSAAPSAPST